MDYRVVLSASARADLRDIVRYISFDAPDRALQFGLFLISRTQLLAHSPNLGESYRSLTTRSFERSSCARIALFTASTIRAIESKSFAFGTPPVTYRKSMRDDRKRSRIEGKYIVTKSRV